MPESILVVNDSPGISKLNIKTAPLLSLSNRTFSAKFIAKDVLPILGLPATTIKSPSCIPKSFLSRSVKPVEEPIKPPFLFDNS